MAPFTVAKVGTQIDWNNRYETIQDFLYDPYNLVENGTVYPIWASKTVFWYSRKSADGVEVRIVDVRDTSIRTVAYATLTGALEKLLCGSDPITEKDLKIASYDIVKNSLVLGFGERTWSFGMDDESLQEITQEPCEKRHAFSPNGECAVFLRDHDLWIRTDADGTERQVTSDGEEANAYASAPLANRGVSDFLGLPPEGLWSPDSKYFFTLRTDERRVRALPTMEYLPEEGVRPQVRTNRTSLPGDEHITQFTLLLVEAETGQVRPVNFPELPAVRMNDTIFGAELAWWSADSEIAYFVCIDRGEKSAHVIACDVATGETRSVFSEESESPIEISVNVYGPALIKNLPSTNELIWYSERSGHGHLYLYDLESGQLKRQLTDGDWQVREVLAVNESVREVFFLASGIDASGGQYKSRPCKTSLDGVSSNITLLREDEGNHIIWRPNEFGSVGAVLDGLDPRQISGSSPGSKYFVDTIARVDGLPKTIVFDADGVLVMPIEECVNNSLPESWQWPVEIKAKASDGKTDVYGLLFFPVDFDPSSSYPLIDHIYGGPQVRNCPQGAFGDQMDTTSYVMSAAFAQLGAFVLVLDGRGTAERDREFRRFSWGKVHEASSIEDHISAIRQLSDTYPSIDLERVGITGFSAGGYAAAHAALRFGDFFSVAVAGAGNYDQSLFWHTWGERYHGSYDAKHYNSQAAKTYADGLTGKILFIHGLRDWGCHPAGLFQLLQALIEKNKDYDLVLMPAVGHNLTGYGARRRLDYFVTHLFKEEPPMKRFAFPSAYDAMSKKAVEHAPSISDEIVEANSVEDS